MIDKKLANELINEIGTIIVESKNYQDRDWEAITIIAIIEEASEPDDFDRSIRINGYTYDAAGNPTPARPGNPDLHDKFEELREAMREEGKQPWKSALVQIKRPELKINIDFEYEDAEKWLVSPSDIDSKPRELRPK